MAMRESREIRSLQNAAAWAENWLSTEALPVWWQRGTDHISGGFFEKLSQNGLPIEEPRRFRVAPRQLYVYGESLCYGLYDRAPEAVEHALKTVRGCYVKGQGFPKLLSPTNEIIDSSFDLYDNAFGLFGLAYGYKATHEADLIDMAKDLVGVMDGQFAHPLGGYIEPLPLRANPHMHLFEAFMAWAEVTEDDFWYQRASAMAKLATERFIDSKTNTLREYFDLNWHVFAAPQGQVVEPGHHYEWAWLFERWLILSGEDYTDFGAALYDMADENGYDPERGVAVDEITPEGMVVKPTARQWPQTERLKAALGRWKRTGERKCLIDALSSVQTLQLYLSAPTPGLWHDTMLEDGSFKSGPAWASSFYHYVCALIELRNAVEATSR